MSVLAIRLLSSVTAGSRLNGSDLANQPQQIKTPLALVRSNSSYLQLSRTWKGGACQPTKKTSWLFRPTGSQLSTLAVLHPIPRERYPGLRYPERPKRRFSIAYDRCECCLFQCGAALLLGPWLCFKAHVPQTPVQLHT